MDATINPFKKGMIILWSGLIADIPGGFALCDGTNGTPNLKNNFVVGAGDAYVVGATGGSINHLHSGSPAFHTHTLTSPGAIASGSPIAQTTGGPSETGNVDSANGLPPYYALAYIMKL